MDVIEALRCFRVNIERRLGTKTSWGRNEAMTEVKTAYQDVLEELISPSAYSGHEKLISPGPSRAQESTLESKKPVQETEG